MHSLSAFAAVVFKSEALTAKTAFVDSAPKDYTLSVPAIWSDQARERTLDSAYRAGYGRRFSPEEIRLVAEPEAAAAYTITTVSILTTSYLPKLMSSATKRGISAG